jgi:hypothetical protein
VQVRQVSELSQVNERCLDLQRNKSASSSSRHKSTPADGHGSIAINSVVGFSGAPKPRARQQRRQRSSRKPTGCPFLSFEGGAAGLDDFKDLVLGAPMDVEELASLGRKMKVGASVWWDRPTVAESEHVQLSGRGVQSVQTANRTCRSFA